MLNNPVSFVYSVFDFFENVLIETKKCFLSSKFSWVWCSIYIWGYKVTFSVMMGQTDTFFIRLCGKNNICDEISYKYGLFSNQNYSSTIWTKNILFPQSLTFNHSGSDNVVKLMDIYFETYTLLSPILELNQVCDSFTSTCGVGEYTFVLGSKIIFNFY